MPKRSKKTTDPVVLATKIQIAFAGGWLSRAGAVDALKAIGLSEESSNRYLDRASERMVVIRV